MKKILLLPIVVFTLLLTSCKKDAEETPTISEKSATLRVKLEHTFNGDPLSLESDYITTNGDTIQISELKYFLSNLTLINSESETLKIDNSYYLVEVDNSSNIYEIEIPNLDEATYNSFSVSVGVDSALNHSIVNATGDLDPNGADQMIWTWSTGYKFIKFEGDFQAKDTTGSFIYHVGGDANYKTFTFGESAVEHTEHENARLTTDELHIALEDDKTTEIHLVVDLAEFFVSPNTIDLKTTNKAHGSAASLLMNNIHMSMNEGKNGWFELHHIMQF